MCGEFVDIHDTLSGRRLGTIEFTNRKGCGMRMDPNGTILAVGMETGEILQYNEAEGNFLVDPVIVENSREAVTSIAFSPDSKVMTISTCENKVYIYNKYGFRTNFTINL